MKKTLLIALAAVAASTLVSSAAGIKFTELMYTGLYGEFVEITNTNTAGSPISLSGWHYSDNHAATSGSNSLDLTPIGSLAAGKSAILTEADPGVFNTVWFTLPSKTAPAGLVVIGNVTVNLGRSDALNLFDNSGTNVDTLVFNDEAAVGTLGAGIKTEDVSAFPPAAALGTNNFSAWTKSTTANGAWKSGNTAGNGSIGSPGTY